MLQLLATIFVLIGTCCWLWVMTLPLRNKAYPQPIPASWNHVRVAKQFISTIQYPIRVCEVGSGTFGRFRSVAKSANVDYTGVELQRILYWLSCLMRNLLPYKTRVHFFQGDATRYDLGNFDIYIFFLGGALNELLTQKLLTQKTTCYIITPVFKLPVHERIRLIKEETHWTGSTYIYQMT